MITHVSFVGTEEAVAAIVGTYSSHPSGRFDKFHHFDELAIGEFQVRVVGGTTEGENGEQAPTADAQRDQVVAELGKVLDGALVDASDDIPSEAGVLLQSFYGDEHILVAVGVATHPVVVVFKAIEADSDGFQASSDIFVK